MQFRMFIYFSCIYGIFGKVEQFQYELSFPGHCLSPGTSDPPLETHFVKSPMQCGFVCSKTPDCNGFNIRTNPIKGPYECELIIGSQPVVKEENPECKHYDHINLLNNSISDLDKADAEKEQAIDATTAKPTTTNPTTANPTTANPTTANPTTANPTTANPTTAKPTTITTTKAATTTITTTKAATTTKNPVTAPHVTANAGGASASASAGGISATANANVNG